MEIETAEVGGAMVLRPAGEVDMAHATTLRDALGKATKAKKTPVVINFEQVEYIDSAGVATLVECLRNVRDYGGELRLCCASESVKDVFEIANLVGIFGFFDAEDEAAK